jgi:hypothetical protein
MLDWGPRARGVRLTMIRRRKRDCRRLRVECVRNMKLVALHKFQALNPTAERWETNAHRF